MQYTSAEAAKLLRKINEEIRILQEEEQQCRVFNAALGEDVESVRPAYDYAATQAALKELNRKVRVIRHAISIFNLSHEVPGFGMTVDQLLVYIPQLTEQKSKLSMMARRLPKQRENVRAFGQGASVIDYSYANYDIAQVKADYEAVSDELAKAQTALDLINSTEKMEIDI